MHIYANYTIWTFKSHITHDFDRGQQNKPAAYATVLTVYILGVFLKSN